MFRFGWYESDDTPADDDIQRLGIQVPQFGRGHLGGMFDIFGFKGSVRSHLRDARHWSKKPRDQKSDREWRTFREDFLMTIRSSNAPAPNPVLDWDEIGLPPKILDLMKRVFT
ncbi:unnamed protein product [Agarophyton chilense]